MKCLLSDCISLSFCPNLTKWNNFNINDINETPDYKEIEKLFNLNFEYSTKVNSNEEENYDKLFNDSKSLSDLKFEKFKRLYK